MPPTQSFLPVLAPLCLVLYLSTVRKPSGSSTPAGQVVAAPQAAATAAHDEELALRGQAWPLMTASVPHPSATGVQASQLHALGITCTQVACHAEVQRMSSMHRNAWWMSLWNALCEWFQPT